VTVDVHVVTPEREIWSGDASMVVARGTEGELGILGGHIPLLIRLAIAPMRIHRDGDVLQAVVDGGFLHVTSEGDTTRVDVLASGAELASEIDVDAARAAEGEMEVRVRANADDVEARDGLARARARIAVRG
jgi:F-type H+-transporting ATPase subunit epsilon